MAPPASADTSAPAQGCTRGFHSDVKPPEPEKPAKRASPGADEQIFSPQTPNRKLEAPAPRPDFDTPMVRTDREVSTLSISADR